MLKTINTALLFSLIGGFCVAQPQIEEISFAAPQDPVGMYMDEARLIGSATHEVVFWDIYDLTLYAEERPFMGSPPYALEIAYNKGFTADLIADKSIALIREQNFDDEMRLAEWHSQLINIFPDVSKGTVLTGIYTDEKETAFYCDGEYIGEIKDPEFGLYFFNIWLGEDSSEPKLRRELIGSESVDSD
ncbi:MAG: hypothetical protein HOL48_10535 [Porticoccaceae bacterium]|nr:hypothetical protein [Porticoccaceae bacterium]